MPRRTASVRTLGLVVLLAASVHCAETPPTARPTLVADPIEEEPGANPDAPVSSPPLEQPVEQPGAVPGEPPKDCAFRVKEQCYAERDAACQAAGCALDKCRVMESYPAQIACD